MHSNNLLITVYGRTADNVKMLCNGDLLALLQLAGQSVHGPNVFRSARDAMAVWRQRRQRWMKNDTDTPATVSRITDAHSWMGKTIRKKYFSIVLVFIGAGFMN